MAFFTFAVFNEISHEHCCAGAFCTGNEKSSALKDVSRKLYDCKSENNKNSKSVEYETPFKYCDVEGVNSRRITGVRHHGVVSENSHIDILHEREAQLLRGPPPPPERPSGLDHIRPYLPVAVKPEKLKMMQDRKIEVDSAEYQRAMKAEEKFKERIRIAIRDKEL